MATEDITPRRALREVPCISCGGVFLARGAQARRCEPCFIENKRRRERENKRAKCARPKACIRCGEAFPPTIHAATKYCETCAPIVHREQTVALMAKQPDKQREAANRHYAKKREAILERRKNAEWRQGAARRQKRRRDDDPSYRLHCNISRVVSLGLNGKKSGRKWQTLVGYTLEQLRLHLERQFLKGMTWDNYGTVWHVDHIQPRTTFTFETSDDDGFKACWALTNLRPLRAKDNMSKGSKVLLLL
jgi:hypothetical protein